MSDFEILKYDVIPNSSYQKIKVLCVKSTEKVLQDEWMYVATTAVVKLWDFSRRFQLNYEILLPAFNTFTGHTEEYSIDVN